MSLFSSLTASASGMTAERVRMDVVADNLANVNTPGFKRGTVTFGPSFDETLGGVRVVSLNKDNAPGRRVYQPGNPSAGPDGYVEMPNISTVVEMVDMMTATRAYEANVAAVQAAKQMAMKALEIARA